MNLQDVMLQLAEAVRRQCAQDVIDVEGIDYGILDIDLAPIVAAHLPPSEPAWTADAEHYGKALNDAAWAFLHACPEDGSSLKMFNYLKPCLRAAILKYAESVEAARLDKATAAK